MGKWIADGTSWAREIEFRCIVDEPFCAAQDDVFLLLLGKVDSTWFVLFSLFGQVRNFVSF